MTRPDYTHIEVLIDRSGSMAAVTSDVIGGFNTFLDEQRKVGGKTTISLTQFDDEYEPNYTMKQLDEATKLSLMTYIPRGWTALNDAVGRMITNLGAQLNAMAEIDRPSKVLVVIQTDGQENKSREFNISQVLALVKEQEEKYNWQFLFLGAGLGVAQQGTAFGISNSASYNNTSKGVSAAYTIASVAVAGTRTGMRSMCLNVSEIQSLNDTK